MSVGIYEIKSESNCFYFAYQMFCVLIIAIQLVRQFFICYLVDLQMNYSTFDYKLFFPLKVFRLTQSNLTSK